MEELIYALRFRGESRPIGIDGNVLTIAARALGCTVISRIGADGLSGTFHPARGAEARLEAEVIFTGATTFQESGTISFGTGEQRFCFSTVGSGYLGPAAAGSPRHGAAIWQIEGGEGQFAGATGLITSCFLVSDAGTVTDHHLGVVFLRETDDVTNASATGRPSERNDP